MSETGGGYPTRTDKPDVSPTRWGSKPLPCQFSQPAIDGITVARDAHLFLFSCQRTFRHLPEKLEPLGFRSPRGSLLNVLSFAYKAAGDLPESRLRDNRYEQLNDKHVFFILLVLPHIILLMLGMPTLYTPFSSFSTEPETFSF